MDGQYGRCHTVLPLMTETECQQLRALLFANCLPSPLSIPVFRYIAVLPEQGEYDATVHYAYSLEDWHLGGCDWDDAQAYVGSLIEQTPFNEKRILLCKHVHEEGSHWPIPWDMTLRDESNDTQILVLVSQEDGAVTGALLRNLHHGDAYLKTIAATYAEPQEVEQLLADFEKLQPHDFWFFGMYFDRRIKGEVCGVDVEALGQLMASSLSGSKYVLHYGADHDWKWGALQVSGRKQQLHLESLSDHYAIRASQEKRARRPGIEGVRANASLRGDYSLLNQALALLGHRVEYHGHDCEQDEAIRLICDWWNVNAPERFRSADIFHLYCWDEHERIFLSGEQGEPARLASHVVSSGPYALFEEEGEPLVVVSFCKGRTHNRQVGDAVHVYSVNGEPFHVYRDTPLDSVDEVSASWAGLKALRSRRWDAELNAILSHPEFVEEESAGPEDMLSVPGYTFTMHEDMMTMIGDDIHLSWNMGGAARAADGKGSVFSVKVEPTYLSIQGQGMRVALPIYGADAHRTKTYLRERGFDVVRSGGVVQNGS